MKDDDITIIKMNEEEKKVDQVSDANQVPTKHTEEQLRKWAEKRAEQKRIELLLKTKRPAPIKRKGSNFIFGEWVLDLYFGGVLRRYAEWLGVSHTTLGKWMRDHEQAPAWPWIKTLKELDLGREGVVRLWASYPRCNSWHETSVKDWLESKERKGNKREHWRKLVHKARVEEREKMERKYQEKVKQLEEKMKEREEQIRQKLIRQGLIF